MSLKHIRHIFIMIAALAAWGCSGGSGDGRPVLSVSIEPQRKMLEELAGDRFNVVCVLARGANPESFDPSMSQRADLNKSAAFFITGYLPYEETLRANLNSGVKIVNTSAGIKPVTGTHCLDHSHGSDQADPHVWASLRNARVMAANMTAALKELDPDHSDEYQQRYEKMAARLDSLDALTARELRRAGVHAFAVWHPSLSYYARDYGLHQISVGQESKEVSVGALRKVIEEARADSVKVFFYQKEYDSRQATNISEEVGAMMVPVNITGYDWEEELMHVLQALTNDNQNE